ncbi:MAG: hypothetical protein ACOYOK_03360 [Pseudobdellovibrionaceae bacterium]|jgi:hypothetical protein
MDKKNQKLSDDLLQKLVDELLKTSPEVEVVKNLTHKLNIPFSEDPILQMNSVLQAMHGANRTYRTQKELDN